MHLRLREGFHFFSPWPDQPVLSLGIKGEQPIGVCVDLTPNTHTDAQTLEWRRGIGRQWRRGIWKRWKGEDRERRDQGGRQRRKSNGDVRTGGRWGGYEVREAERRGWEMCFGWKRGGGRGGDENMEMNRPRSGEDLWKKAFRNEATAKEMENSGKGESKIIWKERRWNRKNGKIRIIAVENFAERPPWMCFLRLKNNYAFPRAQNEIIPHLSWCIVSSGGGVAGGGKKKTTKKKKRETRH